MVGKRNKHGQLYPSERRKKWRRKKKIQVAVDDVPPPPIENDEAELRRPEELPPLTVAKDCPTTVGNDEPIITGGHLEELGRAEDLLPLTIEKDCPTTNDNHEPIITGRRLTTMSNLISQFKELSDHGVTSCGLKYIEIVKETRKGLQSYITMKCSLCNHIAVIDTDQTEKMSANLSITSGMVAVGVGYSNMQEVFAALDVPFMAHGTYKKCEEKIHDVSLQSALAEMKNAAEEEKKISIQLGEVDFDGVPLVPVVVDGSWAKRSYKNKYDSLSGIGVIVGLRTKKILYIAVKNRYCFVCARAEGQETSASEHTCFKNWSGSSTSMEPAAILEGFKKSEELYGVRYNRVIGDGDSSVYNTLVSNRPYKNTFIEKVECSNHLLRNLCKKLRSLVDNRSIGTGFLRKELGSKVTKLRGSINAAAKYWAKQTDIPLEQRIEQLSRDVKNAPLHAFGQHSNCATYFCSGTKANELNLVPDFRKQGLWSKMEDVFTYLARHSKSLIQRMSSNLAENFNSQIAKFIGGKRVNFCMRGSYQARCYSAVVSANSRALQTRIHKGMYNKSPGKFTKLLEQRRFARLKKCRAKCKKKLFTARNIQDKDYGLLSCQPDLDPTEMEKETNNFLLSLRLSDEERDMLERGTQMQNQCALWHSERRKRLTASNFGVVCKRRVSTKCQKLVERLLYAPPIHSRAIEYGSLSEEKALSIVQDSMNIAISKCGLFIDKEYLYLGASPDGLMA